MESKVEKFRPKIAPYLEHDVIWKRDPHFPKTPISRMVERIGVYMWNKYIVKWEFGLLPREYNFKVHGPYVPWRYYGKLDTPFFDLKVKDVPSWILRRDLSPLAGLRASARAWHYYLHRFRDTKYLSMVFIWQFIFGSAFVLHMFRTERHVWRRRARYHW
jgi:F-type H+-transporting ATPase subunit f